MASGCPACRLSKPRKFIGAIVRSSQSGVPFGDPPPDSCWSALRFLRLATGRHRRAAAAAAIAYSIFTLFTRLNAQKFARVSFLK